MRPDIVRCHRVIGRQIFGALAGGNDFKAARARPVDQLAGERRLIAVGERIDNALGPRLCREERSCQHVGLDIHHHDVLARGDGSTGVRNARRRRAGRLDHDIDIGVAARLVAGRDKRRALDPRRVPPDPMAREAGSVRVEVGDDGDFQAADRRHLREEHRAKLAGADETDPYRRTAVHNALLQ